MGSSFDQIIVAPSLLAGDFSQLGAEARRVEAAGADWLHLDVMDGHFVDNISFGPAVVAAMKKAVGLTLDVHLMISRPDHYLKRFIEAGAHSIQVHLEAQARRGRHAETPSAEAGCLAGLALNPATPLADAAEHLPNIDLLLVMTVNPGFGGQEFIAATMDKVAEAARPPARGERLEVPHRGRWRHQGRHGERGPGTRRERAGGRHLGLQGRRRCGAIDPGTARPAALPRSGFASCRSAGAQSGCPLSAWRCEPGW